MNKAWMLIAAVFALTACDDPLLEEKIASLGPEQPRFDEEEEHRVGQPCVFCHQAGQEGEPIMSIGGTLFHRPQTGAPFVVGGYVVEVVDAEGTVASARANRCGNFYFTRSRFDPVFPVRTRVLHPQSGAEVSVMNSHIAEEASCGACHTEPRGPLSAGVIDVPGDDTWFTPPSPGACPEPRFLPVFELPADLR